LKTECKLEKDSGRNSDDSLDLADVDGNVVNAVTLGLHHLAVLRNDGLVLYEE